MTGRYWENCAAFHNVEKGGCSFLDQANWRILFHLQQKPKKTKHKICTELTFSRFQPNHFNNIGKCRTKLMKYVTTSYSPIITITKNWKYCIFYRNAEMRESSGRVEDCGSSPPFLLLLSCHLGLPMCTSCWNLWHHSASVTGRSCVVSVV